ncbi:hypothetical protein GJ496_004646, partial [Pomphorhynchus laevis]
MKYGSNERSGSILSSTGDHSNQLRESAAVVLQESWRIYMLTKLHRVVDGNLVRRHQKNFLQAVYRLRNLRFERNQLSDNTCAITDFSK